ncbi:MAG: hypothetical protein ACYCOU_14880 [Sulfobacillus sp.]
MRLKRAEPIIWMKTFRRFCEPRYVLPCSAAARDAMPALFDPLEQGTEPGVRAVLELWMLGDAYRLLRGAVSIDLDMGPFAGFIEEQVRWSLEQTGDRCKRTSP